MAAQTNGRAKKPKKSTSNGTLNGSLNGSLNGYANGHMNGHADKTQSSSTAVTSSRQRKQRRSMTGAFISVVARLTTWYLIITLLFRCPSSLTHINDSSPRVCKPYLQARSYAAPHLDPYYQTYVAPHVEKVKPYTDGFERHVYTPAAAFTKDKYATYGAHRVEHATKYAEAQYNKAIRPQLQNAQDVVKGQYNLYLGPHVKTASDAAAPYYDQAKASLEEIYHLSILPAYEASLPYLQKAHTHGHHLLVDTVFPHVRSARDAVWAFVVRTIWPQLRVLYGDNVEPQLVRISERLGRYRDQQKVESVVDAIDSQTATTTESTKVVPTVASSSVSIASPSSTTKSGWGVLDDFFGGSSSSTASSEAHAVGTDAAKPAEPKLSGAELKEKLNEDLRQWQSKFATAADKGAEDLEQRVAEITKRQVENAVKGHGRALVVKLEETADSTVAKLKTYIKKTVKSIPEEATEDDLNAAYEECSAKTREFGLNVKERAQDVRAWKAAFDQETDSLVQAAVGSTVEVLEKIHGLGLQEVGMRWAWTDGVTYKDWQNYHKLRETLNEWQAEVEAVGSRHDGLLVAHEEAKKLEDEAMTVASNMVAELVRLKDVSKWKIWAGDATDDFSDKKVPVRVFKATQQVKDNIEDAASQVSEAIQGTSTPLTESIASSVQEALSEASSQAAEVVQGTSTPLSESIASSVSSGLSEASSQASEVLQGSSSSAEDVLSKASEAATDSASKASVAYDQPKKVFGGANAQILAEAKQVIFDEPLDDDDDDADTYSEKLQGVIAGAGDQAAELSRAVSEALLGPSKTQGTVESVTSLASEQYAQALAAASSVLYGTKQPAVESATSVAADKFAQAVTAASYAIYGTPTPTAIIKTINVQASSRYNDAVRVASEQLENAKSQLSLLVSGTPKPAHETIRSYFEKAYSDSVAAAGEQLSAALQYTESVKSYAAGPTQGYFESVSSIASSRLAEGLSQASAQFSTQPTGAVNGARQQYYQAVGLAHARYSEFVDAASSAVYGPQQGTVESLASVASASAASAASVVSGSAESAASYVSGSAQSAAANAQAAAESLASQVSSGVIGSETPWTESVASQASQNWEALIAQASNQVYGKPTPWAESVYAQAGAYGAQATAAAVQQYAGVQALISELVVGKEPDFTESVMNRFSSAYYSGVPAAASSVSSYASEQFEAASSIAGDGYDAVTDAAANAYASASSVVGSIFTPPAMIEDVLSQASASLDLAVESASIALYGTPKGVAEQASESVASAYSSIQSQISVQVYGTQQAQDSFSSAAVSAQAAISQAIFGTPTAADYVASATGVVGDTYASISSAASENAGYVASVASENAAYASSAISSAVYGPEQGAMESANSRIAAAVEAANSKIAEMYAAASEGVEGAASSVASAATEATQRVKDEL
ncbi:Nn.00g003840.m01.CDS01 [Neocucurbitaria sp. VM-36]